jgi:hypothetical protein
MITVQWAETGEMTFTGLDYQDKEYLRALEHYYRESREWDIVRILFSSDDEADWVLLYEHRAGE